MSLVINATILGSAVALGAALALTNPNEQVHRDALVAHVKEHATSSVKQFLSAAKVVTADATGSDDFKYENYYVMSALNYQGKRVTMGILNTVYIFEDKGKE